MLSSSGIAFVEGMGGMNVLFSATYAWDGIVRRHIHAENLSIGRVDLFGRRAIAVGICALLWALGCAFVVLNTWSRLFQACDRSVACTMASAAQPLASSGIAIGLLLFGVSWVGFWLWRVRPGGYVRQWVGPGTYEDEGEIVKRVPRALEKEGFPPVDGGLLMQISRELKMRMTPIAFQPNSPFVENGRLVVHRFVGSIVNSAFGNRFHLPKPQLRIIFTTIAEYYVEIGENANTSRLARKRTSDQ